MPAASLLRRGHSQRNSAPGLSDSDQWSASAWKTLPVLAAAVVIALAAVALRF
jgi:hypothetical protein